MTNPSGGLDLDVLNSETWRAPEIPAVNGHGTARAIARFYAALGGWLPEPLFSPALRAEVLSRSRKTMTRCSTGRSRGEWACSSTRATPGWAASAGPTARCISSRGFAFGYVTRHLGNHDRAIALADTVEACLAS